MDDSSTAEGDSMSMGPTVASILGIKGPLRFRPHGSSQKAHVVLRRVEISDDSSSDGELNHFAYFSLFAQKRIEVKPGKEILLTVAAPDGRFKDQAVIFEGDILETDEASDEEDETQVAEEEDIYMPPVGEVIPPKMRRTWTKRNEDASPAVHNASVALPAVGVRAEPVAFSSSVHDQPKHIPASVQAHPLYVSVSVQHPPSPPNISSLSQEADQSVSPTLQTVEVPPKQELVGLSKYQSKQSRGTEQWEKERSLSPMELDSPSYTPPPDSPILSPTGIPQTHPRLSSTLPSPHSPASSLSSISSSSGAQDMQMSPVDAKTSDILIVTRFPPHCHSPRVQHSKYEYSNRREDVQEHSQQSTLSAAQSGLSQPSQSNVLASTSSCVKLNSDTSAKHLARASPPNHRPGPSESSCSNHTARKDGKFAAEVDVKDTMSMARASPKPDVKLASVRPTDDLSSSTASQLERVHQPPLRPAPPNKRSDSRAAFPQNAIASSSKVFLDRAVPPSAPRSLASITKISPSLATTPQSLPPVPASLSHISMGPLSNPLNIQPSPNPTLQKVQRAPPIAPKLMTQAMAQTSAKKRSVVGGERPLVRQPNGVATGLPGSSLTPSLPSHVPQADPYTFASSIPPLPSFPTREYDMNSSTSTFTLPYSTPSPPPLPQDKLIMQFRPRSIKVEPSKPSIMTQPKDSVVVGSQSQSTSLKDRSSIATPLPIHEPTAQVAINQPTSGLLSRKSPQGASSSCEKFPVCFHEPLPSTKATKNPLPQTPTSSSTLPQPLNHPLPPKPSETRAASKSKKRQRPQSPDDEDSPSKQSLKWPTNQCVHSTQLKGEGDLGIREIVCSPNGSLFVLRCCDRTIRIWNTLTRKEMARLSHNNSVVGVAWMQHQQNEGMGIISLSDDGLISKWTRTGRNHWEWEKLLDSGNEHRGDDDSICLAYLRGRIAVALPRSGVKVWILSKGTWQPQRSILRQNVTTIRFIEDGEALLGGTRDGVVWCCEVPNGTLRAYAFLKHKISSIDVDPTGSYALIQAGSCAHLVGIRRPNKGKIMQVYSNKDTELHTTFGAVFACRGQAVLFGSVERCVLVWDQKKGAVVYGMDHSDDDPVQAIVNYDGSPYAKLGCLITGTKQGKLNWWLQPVSPAQSDDSRKRIKLSSTS